MNARTGDLVGLLPLSDPESRPAVAHRARDGGLPPQPEPNTMWQIINKVWTWVDAYHPAVVVRRDHGKFSKKRKR